MMTIGRQTSKRPTPSATAPRDRGPIGKRAFDIVAGTILAILALPLIAVLAVAVAVSLRSWPFFVQQRIGRGGELFTFPKLRTLPPSTPKYADKYALTSVQTTRLGAFLRAMHLDELPQLFLVPVGRMSLVGPRPEMEAVAAEFPSSFVEARTRVRPGCTGLWQVGEAKARLIAEAPHFDLFYLHHAGVRLDLWILWRTARAYLPGGGLVSLDDVPAWARAQAPAREVVIDLTAEERAEQVQVTALLHAASEA